MKDERSIKNSTTEDTQLSPIAQLGRNLSVYKISEDFDSSHLDFDKESFFLIYNTSLTLFQIGLIASPDLAHMFVNLVTRATLLTADASGLPVFDNLNDEAINQIILTITRLLPAYLITVGLAANLEEWKGRRKIRKSKVKK